jgi:Flp pilus assembly protein TadG
LKRKRRQKGHALLESALVLVIFLSFLIGTLDFAQFLYFHQSLVERVRAAARYGAVNPTDVTGIKNMAVYNSTTAAANPMVPGLTTSIVSVAVEDSGTPASRVTVTVSGYPLQFFSPFIAGSRTAQDISATMITETP